MKRVLSLLVVLAMMVSMIPNMAAAKTEIDLDELLGNLIRLTSIDEISLELSETQTKKIFRWTPAESGVLSVSFYDREWPEGTEIDIAISQGENSITHSKLDEDTPFELAVVAGQEATIEGNIQTIQKYVRENCLNPNAKFVWHMGWAAPTNNALRDTYPFPESNVYYTRYVAYGDNRDTLYGAIVKCVQDKIIPSDSFQYIIPTGTAMENALSSYLDENDIHRDYYHVTDLIRVMNSYVWLCRIFGIEQLTEIKVDAIPMTLFNSINGVQDYVLTDAEKNVLLESINNALKTPFAMTQSQYTTAP